MRTMRSALPCLLVASLALSAAALTRSQQSSGKVDDGSTLVGDWTGESICVGPFPACHDEKVVYRFLKAPDETGKVALTAYKIVAGELELMGVLDFKYDGQTGRLVCDFTRGNTHGLWEFNVKGDEMEGTLVVLPDKTLARKVKVKKDGSKPTPAPSPL